MSLDWSIDHGRRLVAATLDRSTSEEEMYHFLGEVIAEGAMPYGKIFDASTAIQWITASRIGPIAATARLYGRMGLGPVGPLAIVVAGERAMARAREFALLSDASRVVRIFDNRDEAEAWVAAIGAEGEPEPDRT
jgi:hypothetical protein